MKIEWIILIVLLFLAWRQQTQAKSNDELMEWEDYRGHVYKIHITRQIH